MAGVFGRRNIEMARLGTKSIAKRDVNRLSQARSAKDIHQALDRIVKVVRSDASIVSFPKFRKFLGRVSDSEDSLKNLHSQLLDRLKISLDQWTKIEAMTQKWASLYDNPDFGHLVQPLVQDLSAFFGCKTRSFSVPLKDMGLWDFRLLFPDIHLNYFDDEIHMIVVTDSRAGPNEFAAVKDIIHKNDATMKVTLLLVLGNGDQLRELAKTSSIEIVVLDEDDCREIMLSPNSKRMFCHRVARRISVQALQPYQTQGKVRSRMFYGRHDEIKRLKSNLSNSFAIYGGRLIGKSSLLHQIDQEFEHGETGGYRVCSITAQAFTSSVEACRALLKELDIPTAKHRSVLTFERLMRDYLLSHTGRVLILVDEVDDLIVLDGRDNYQMFEAFHNLNNDFGERCRFVFAGYRDLARQCMDSKSRFRNFAEPIRLGNLDPVSARLLIEEPMCEELGFRFESDDLVEKILEMTAGHPNYIQVFCKELTEYLERQQRRRVREHDIEYTYHNADFRDRV
ncbi:MAG: ATP-binding protein, partial [Anaerolineales bacterium]